MTVASAPSFIDGEGKSVGTAWVAQAFASRFGSTGDESGAIGVSITSREGMKLTFQFFTKQATPTEFSLDSVKTVFVTEVGTWSNHVEKDTMEMSFVASNGGSELDDVNGQLTLEGAVATFGSSSATMAVDAKLVDAKLKTADGKTFTANGRFSVSGRGVKQSTGGTSSGGTSSGGTSSSGGSSNCSKAWTCANDGQVTPLCNAACAYTGTQRTQTCGVLAGYGASVKKCCSVCK